MQIWHADAFSQTHIVVTNLASRTAKPMLPFGLHAGQPARG